MIEVTINAGHNNWLNQEKLRDALRRVYHDSFSSEYKVIVPTLLRPKNTVRIDITFKRDNQKIAVEYDGYWHYINTRKCIRDEKKKKALEEEDYKVICFPFYMELTTESFSHFFGKEVKGEVVTIRNIDPKPLPHGFNETEWMPIDFCPKGLARFLAEYESLPSKIQDDITVSLKEQAKLVGMENVVQKEYWEKLKI